jgi:hypothetical protein
MSLSPTCEELQKSVVLAEIRNLSLTFNGIAKRVHSLNYKNFYCDTTTRTRWIRLCRPVRPKKWSWQT